VGKARKRRDGKLKGRPGISLRSVLQRAAAKERAAHRLYAGFAARVDDASARGLLLDLAREEQRHVRIMSGLAKGRRKLPDEKVSGVAADLHITEYLRPVSLSPKASFQQVLIYAMKREGQALEAYRAMAEAVSDPRVRKACRFLAGQERAHKLRLERFYDDVVYREN
jgi:rubrerythrin